MTDTTWGEGLLGRRPGHDDGDWKALEDAFEVSGHWPNFGCIMWYNVVTHEHRWARPSFEELQEAVDTWRDQMEEQISDMSHLVLPQYVLESRNTTIKRHHTCVEIVHSLVHPARWAGEEPEIEKSTAYSSELADEGTESPWRRSTAALMNKSTLVPCTA